MEGVDSMSAIDFIENSFNTEKELSKNGHGIVTLVRRKTDGKKFIRKEYPDNKTEIFNILKTMDLPEFPHIAYLLFAGRTIVIEEYVEGISLDDLITKGMHPANFNVTRLLQKLLPALSALHNAGIIHRDIKPEHIILDKNLQPHLIDFGIARLKKQRHSQDTEILGTRQFAPPEQFGYQQTDERSDIYSLGQTLVALAHFVPMNSREKEIIQKAISFSPADRFQNADCMLLALNQAPSKLKRYGIPAIIILVLLGFAFLYQYEHNSIEENTIPESPAHLDTTTESVPATQNTPATPSSNTITNNQQSPKDKEKIPPPQVPQTPQSAPSHAIEEPSVTDKNSVKDNNIEVSDTSPLHVTQGSSRQKVIKINNSYVTVNASNNGNQLELQLSNDTGSTAYYSFTYEPPAVHSYNNLNCMDGDIIFMDINNDGTLDIVPIMTNAFAKGDNYFIDGVNAWAVTYDSNSGFQKCDGMAKTSDIKVCDGYLLDDNLMVYRVDNGVFTSHYL